MITLMIVMVYVLHNLNGIVTQTVMLEGIPARSECKPRFDLRTLGLDPCCPLLWGVYATLIRCIRLYRSCLKR